MDSEKSQEPVKTNRSSALNTKSTRQRAETQNYPPKKREGSSATNQKSQISTKRNENEGQKLINIEENEEYSQGNLQKALEESHQVLGNQLRSSGKEGTQDEGNKRHQMSKGEMKEYPNEMRDKPFMAKPMMPFPPPGQICSFVYSGRFN